MAKQLNVNLAFSADTGQARAQLLELQNSLNNLTRTTANSSHQMPITKSIQEALSSASELKIMLEQATNVETGNLDLTKFSNQLKSSGKDLNNYARQLTELGPAGEQAFINLARSIATAEVPLRRTNSLMTEMWTTMKNTARWQLTSSMLHGFMGAVQSAYGYTKDLDKSLNNIRIVTGYSSDKMASFAKEANKAAKALSTTTTSYTDASLIYYQQGLSDAEVKERTDITIKMANAAGQSAQIVSDQMTAVWNNFDDGSKSLEYYADVMTALGAATASSTDEIAAGLEKFAAIADTVGLSYEYSTAALATITSNTRQSADVVGNALKTLFARVQGLSLGETLEDGVDLNKYSSALKSVGVEVLRANGELRDMDDILVDLAAKWDTISKAEQTALAQTVAGVRQYTQLVALMDNWDDMEINLKIAQNAEGTLQDQADIYAESWDASSKRVKASMQGLYDSLLDEDFFIGINNVLEDVFSGTEKVVDALGGMPGVLSLIAFGFSKAFGPQLAASIDNAVNNFRVFTGVAENEADILRTKLKQAIDVFNRGLEPGSSGAFEGQVLKQQIDRTLQLQKETKNLTAEQIAYRKELIQLEAQFGANAVAAKKAAEEAPKQKAETKRKFASKAVDAGTKAAAKEKSFLKEAAKKTEQEAKQATEAAERAKKQAEKAKQELASAQRVLDNSSEQDRKKAQSKRDSAQNKYNKAQERAQEKEADRVRAEQKNQQAQSRIAPETLQQMSSAVGDSVEQQYNEIGASIEAFSEKVQSAHNQIVNLNDSLKPKSRGATILDGLKDVDLSAFPKLKAAVEEYKKAVADGAPEEVKKKALQQLKNELRNTANSTQEVSSAIEKEAQELRRANSEVNITTEEIRELGQATADASRTMNNGERAASAYSQRIKETDQAIQNATKAQATYGQAISKGFQGASSLLMGINSIKSIFDTLNNEDMSFFEKTLSIMTSLTFALPALGSGFVALANARKTWLGVEKQSIATHAMALLGLKAEQVASYQAAAGQAADTTATLADIVATKLHTIAEGANTGSIKANTAAKLENIIATYGLIAPILALVAALAAVAAIAIIVEKAIVTSEEAKASINSATEAYEEETNKLQELNDELKATQDRIKELEDLDSLSIIEEEELYKLKQTEASLERQLIIQRELAKAKKQEQVDTITDSWNKVAKISTSTPSKLREGVGLFGAAISKTDDDYAEWIEKHKDSLSKEDYAKHVETLNESREQTRSENIQRNAETINANENNFAALVEAYKEGGYGVDLIDLQTKVKDIEDGRKLLFGEDYEAQVLGALAAKQSSIFTSEDFWSGKIDSNSIFGAENLTLEGISSEGMDSYLQNVLSVLKEKGLEQKDLLTLTPEQLSLLFEKIDTIKEEYNKEDDGEFSDYLNSEKFMSKEERKIRADGQGLTQAETHGLDVDEFKAYRDILYETNTELAQQPELLNQVAIAQLRLNKGAKTIKDSYSDLSPLIKKAQKELNSKDGKVSAETWSEISSYIEETTEALGDMLNLDSNALKKIDPKFLVENYDLLTQAANGSQSALDELQANTIKKLQQEIGMASEKFYDLADAMASSGEGIDPGDIIPDVGLAERVSEMYMEAVQAAIDGGMSVADAMAYAQSMINAAQIEIPETEMEAREITVTGDIPDGWEPVLGEPAVTTDASGKQIAVQGTKITAIKSGQYTYTYTVLAPKKGANIAKTSEKVGGGGGSGGGGGGGGGSNRESKQADAGERYHTLTRQLEKIRDEYDELSDAADRAFGPRKLALIDQQIEKLDEEIAKQQELIDAVNDYAKGYEKDGIDETKTDKEVMEQDFYDFQAMASSLGLTEGVNFPLNIEYDAAEGELGNILNYDDIQSAILAAYNAAADPNSKVSDEDFEKLQEQYDKLLESIGQYEETYDKLREEEAKYRELIQQRIDLQLEKVEYEIQIKIDVTEDSLELLEFQLDRLSDNAYSVAEALALLGEQSELTQQQLDTNVQGMKDVLAQSGVTEDEIAGFLNGTVSTEYLAGKYIFSENQIELLREYKSAALDNLKAMEAIREEAENRLTEAFSAWTDELKEGLDVFDHLNKTVSSYKNIINIVGKETLGVTKELMDNLNGTIVNNAVNQLESTRRSWEALKEAEHDASVSLASAQLSGDQKKIDYWTQMLKDINAEEEAMQEAFLSSWESTLTMIVEQFEEAAQEAADVFTKSFTASGAPLSEEYEKVQKQNERYIQDYEKIYQLSKLTRDVNNSINDNNSLAGKAKLKELLKEINAYEEEGVKMSEYDVEYLQKKYELYQAQIALQEAQNAKDTVRLQRDNEGNYSYVYTQSNDKIAEAQQKYEDALFAVQELNYEYLQEMESETVSTIDEMQQAILDIKVSDFATLEEYEAEIDRVTKFYMDQIGYYQGQMQSTVDRNKELYEEDWEAYNRITGYKISANENFVTNWTETMMGGLLGSESKTVDIYERVVASLDVLIGSLLGAYDNMSANIDAANEAAGGSTEDFADMATDAIDEVAEESENAADAVEDMSSRMESGFDSAAEALTKWQTKYSSAMEKAVVDTMGVVDAYNLLIKTLTDQKIATPEKDYGTSSSSGSGNYTGGKTEGDKNGDDPGGPGSETFVAADRAELDAALASGQTNVVLIEKKEIPNANYSYLDSYLKNKQLSRFASGGYTGEWGSEPKVGLLDEKEIVLNKEDTANILDTVNLVRQLTHTIDLNAQAASTGLGRLSAFNFRDERKSDILQQEVTIHAEFPNVQYRSEIEEAFNNLINVSAQYAHRK